MMEDLRSYFKALLRKIVLQTAEHPYSDTALQHGEPLRAERRRETRKPRISACTYGVMRSTDYNGSIAEEGYGTAVNDSPTGMRLLLGVAPSKGQLLEIQTEDQTLEHPFCLVLVEVCWTKPLREKAQEATQENAQEELYLVGCRQSFGSNHDETHIAATRIPRATQL